MDVGLVYLHFLILPNAKAAEILRLYSGSSLFDYSTVGIHVLDRSKLSPNFRLWFLRCDAAKMMRPDECRTQCFHVETVCVKHLIGHKDVPFVGWYYDNALEITGGR